VTVIEAGVGLQLLADEDGEEGVDELPLQELYRLQLQQVVQQERVRVCNTITTGLKERRVSDPDPYLITELLDLYSNSEYGPGPDGTKNALILKKAINKTQEINFFYFLMTKGKTISKSKQDRVPVYFLFVSCEIYPRIRICLK